MSGIVFDNFTLFSTSTNSIPDPKLNNGSWGPGSQSERILTATTNATINNGILTSGSGNTTLEYDYKQPFNFTNLLISTFINSGDVGFATISLTSANGAGGFIRGQLFSRSLTWFTLDASREPGFDLTTIVSMKITIPSNSGFMMAGITSSNPPIGGGGGSINLNTCGY